MWGQKECTISPSSIILCISLYWRKCTVLYSCLDGFIHIALTHIQQFASWSSSEMVSSVVNLFHCECRVNHSRSPTSEWTNSPQSRLQRFSEFMQLLVATVSTVWANQRAEFKPFCNLIGWHGSRSCNQMLQELGETLYFSWPVATNSQTAVHSQTVWYRPLVSF